MMPGCSQPKDMNRIEPIALTEGKISATLTLPASYGAERLTSGRAQFSCQYPSMQPTVNKMDVSDMTVTVRLGRFRKNIAELMLEEAQGDHFDSTRPGAAYRAGAKGEYQVFLRGESANDPKGFNTYYLFKAWDGQWVRVGWLEGGEIYQMERQLNPDASIQYWFKKSKGSNFTHIDEVVTNFVKTHFKSQSVNHQEGQ